MRNAKICLFRTPKPAAWGYGPSILNEKGGGFLEDFGPLAQLVRAFA
jgi:hypothetical protein